MARTSRHANSANDTRLSTAPRPPERNRLLNLPAELREQIYRNILSSPEQGPEILQTCRQIEREARKFLYQRPINFPGQLSLYVWVDATPNHLLPHVTDVSVAIQDIDLQPVLCPRAFTPSLRPQLLTWGLYETEISKLISTLGKLPHIKRIAIKSPALCQSHLYGEFVSRVLRGLHLRLSDVRVVHVTSLHS